MRPKTDACYMGHPRTPANTYTTTQRRRNGRTYVARHYRPCCNRRRRFYRTGRWS